MRNRRHQSPESRKQQILLAAEIVLLKEGIDNFTIDQVVAHAQIAKGTVYKYYKTKDELLAVLAVKSVDMLFREFKTHSMEHNTSLEKLKSIFTASYDFYKTKPQYYSLLSYFEKATNSPELATYQKVSYDLQEFIEKIIDHGKKEGEITTPISTREIDYMVWSSCTGMIQFIDTKKELIKGFEELDERKLIENLSITLINGIK